MTAREMQIEFERRITLMNPDFEIKEKLTSDTIFSFLNAYCERFVRENYLSADNVDTNSRLLKKTTDAIKGLITRKLLSNKITIASNFDNCSTSFVLPENYFLYIRSNSNIETSYKTVPTKVTRKLLMEDLSEFLLENQDMILLENLSAISNDGEMLIGHKFATPNKTIKEEDVEKILSTYYNVPILRNPYVVLNSGTNEDPDVYLTVIHDIYTTVNNIDLIYCRKPKKFNVIGVDGVNTLGYCELPEGVHMEIVEGAVEMFITEAKYRLNIKQN